MNRPGSYQLDLTQGGGTRSGGVLFLRQPTHFRFLGATFADYQPWTGPAPVPGDPPSTPTTTPPPSGEPTPPVSQPVDDLPATGTTGTTVLAVALAVLGFGTLLVRIGRNRPSRGSHGGHCSAMPKASSFRVR